MSYRRSAVPATASFPRGRRASSRRTAPTSIRYGERTSGATPLDHMALMNHPEVRTQLLNLIRTDQAAQIVVAPAPQPASIEEFEQVRQHVEGLARSKAARLAKEVVADYLNGLSPERQQALARRWFIELPKGVPQHTTACADGRFDTLTAAAPGQGRPCQLASG